MKFFSKLKWWHWGLIIATIGGITVGVVLYLKKKNTGTTTNTDTDQNTLTDTSDSGSVIDNGFEGPAAPDDTRGSMKIPVMTMTPAASVSQTPQS